MYIILIIAFAVIPAAIWGMLTIKRKRNNQKIMKLVMEIAALPLEQIPEYAAGFSAFMQNVHGIQLNTMSYMKQVKYILEKYAGLWHPDMSSYIRLPFKITRENLKLPVIAAGAYLGELIRACLPGTAWKKDADIPTKMPYLVVECLENSVISCSPFDIILRVFISGKTDVARMELRPFESREILDETLRLKRAVNVYSDQERENFELFLAQKFGPVKRVFRGVNSPDMLVDLYLFEAETPDPILRLITCGMGGRTMEPPENVENISPDRIELMIDLPADWPLDAVSLNDDQFNWPFRLLRKMIHYPWDPGAWFRLGHAVQWDEPLAQNTELSGVLLASPAVEDYGKCEVSVAPGKEVHLYQMVPLYPEELAYRREHGVRKLYNLLGEKFSFVIDSRRPNAAAGQNEAGTA